MPIDTQTSNSPGWWLDRLLKNLSAERERRDLLHDYYTGDNVIPTHAARSVRDAYQRLMRIARTNFAELIVEAPRQRMQPTGFRTGAEGDDLGDREAWRIWQANSLDADVQMTFRDQMSMGDSYVIVGAMDEEIGAPLITPEDPRQVITEHDPVRKRKVRAALKVFTDDVDGLDHAYLYLPGFVFHAARKARLEGDSGAWEANGWQWVSDPQALPASRPVVPVVRFANRPDTMWKSTGEFENHLSLLDRINYGVLQRLEIATMQAFRQRAIKGLPTHDAQGNEVDYDDIFSADPGALWQIPETAEIWESGQVDLGPVRESVKDDVRDLSAATSTPMYLFTPDAASGSAEGASLLREGLVFKVQDRIAQAAESLEQMMSLAFLFAGDELRATRRDMEALFRPPELFSLSERADAASKAKGSGVPWRTVMTDIWQFSPQAVDRMEDERIREALTGQGTDLGALFDAEGSASQPATG